MKRLGALVAPLIVVLAGCATIPAQITRRSADYLAVGVTSERLKGHSFYLVVGEVDLYRQNWLGKVIPSGRTAEAAVALQADATSGAVAKMVTLQPAEGAPSSWLNAVAVTGGGPYAPADLVGGISVIDLQPEKTWLGAIDAMEKATQKLGGGSVVIGPRREPRTMVIIEPPQPLFWFSWHHHWDHFHRR